MDASFGSADESKVPPPPLETEQQTMESTVNRQDSHDSSNPLKEDGDSLQTRVAKESSQTTDEPLDVQDQAFEKDDVILTGGDNDESSVYDVDQQEANQELESKVIDVEYIPMAESNWLKRLRERPSAITSSSVGQHDAPPVVAATNKAAQEETTEPEKDELSYTSTLPPDSFGDDDFSVDDAAPMTQDNAGSATNDVQKVAPANNPDAQDMPRPQRKKRRLPPLQSRYRSDQDSDVLQQHARPGKTRSRKQVESTTTEPAALAPSQKDETKNPAEASTKPPLKKPPTDTIVPDVVPSVFLLAASKEVTDVPFDFSKAASSTSARRTSRKQEKQQQQRSRRRKRKGPPSVIILLDDDDDSPVPPSLQHHSVVSRGSSRVPKKKSSQEAESKKSSTDGGSGKRRRLKK